MHFLLMQTVALVQQAPSFASSKNAVCDVRSAPYSRMNPQFNREGFAEQLRENGIAYIYLGMELGGRTEDPACYEGKRVRYARLAQKDVFQSGLQRVVEGSTKYRLCLLCAEKDPLECHRTLLVSRYLVDMGLDSSISSRMADSKVTRVRSNVFSSNSSCLHTICSELIKM
jgi:uncharacterized protein (DUF488 family)